MDTPIWLVRINDSLSQCRYFLHRERAVLYFVETGRKYAHRADWVPDSTATWARFGDVDIELREERLNTEDVKMMPLTRKPPPAGTVELYMQLFPSWEGELPHMPSGTALPLRTAPALCYPAETSPGAAGHWVRVHAADADCRGDGVCVWFTQGVVA